MAVVLVLGRLFLAAVFAVAAVAKLRDLSGSRRAAAEFGLPPRPAAVAGTLLPFIELVVAGSLLAVPVAAPAAFAAFALLIAFCLAILVSLARGRAPECHCFGQLHSTPAGWTTVARNLALAAIALGVAGEFGYPVMSAAFAGAAMLALLPAVAFAWWRDRGAETPRVPGPGSAEGLAIGTPAPEFRVPDRAGGEVSLTSLLRRRLPALLLFTDPDCGPCLELAPEIARWQRELREELAIGVIEHASEVTDHYRVMGTPTGVLVGGDGLIASEPAAGGAEIEALIARSVDGFESRLASPSPSMTGHGPPLRRRELLVRAGGAWAATSFFLAWPARAALELRAGQRPCPKPWQRRCGGECLSILMDEDHCGRNCSNLQRCQRSGFQREICSGGRCIRDTDGSTCNVARRTGAGAKGGNAPPPGQCPGGMICCQGNCVDPNRSGNCGGCGGTPQGRRPACCQGLPKDLASDPRNCGACFNRCPEDKPLCYAPPGTSPRDGCRATCGPNLRTCTRNKCFNPRTEYCCGGKVTPKDQAPPNAECCGGELVERPPGAWFCP